MVTSKSFYSSHLQKIITSHSVWWTLRVLPNHTHNNPLVDFDTAIHKHNKCIKGGKKWPLVHLYSNSHLSTSPSMEFSLLSLIYIIGYVTAAPAVINEDTYPIETSENEFPITGTKEGYTHPKLQLFQEENYTIDEVLDELQQEHEKEQLVQTNTFKKDARYN